MSSQEKKDFLFQAEDEKDLQKDDEHQQNLIEKFEQEQFQKINSLSYSNILKDRQGIQSWDYYDQYLKFFSHILNVDGKSYEQVVQAHKDTIHQKIFKNKFFILQGDIQKKNINFYQLKSKVSSYTKNFDVILLFCQLGPFSKKYLVLNEYKESPRHHNDVIGFGTFGKIYDCYHHENEKPSVAKCIKFERDKLEKLRSIIKEFFICDLMSALELGPKVLKNNNFDFIIFTDCLEFKMERCSPLVPDSLEKDIKESLFMMELIQTVHFDIKPANIMFSPEFGRNVLLDFGTAQFIGVNLGQKVPTTFRGTYEFSGEEMRAIFLNSNILREADLYRNDIQMASKSITLGRQTKKSILENFSKNNSQRRQIKNTHENSKLFEILCELKYHMYQNLFADKLSKQTLAKLQLISEIFPIDLIEKLIFEACLYAMRLDKKLVNLFQNEFIQIHPKIRYLNVNPYEDIDWNRQIEKNPTNQKLEKLKRIYFFLNNSLEKLNIQKIEFVKKTFQSLWFFLENHQAKTTFVDHDQVFSLFLKLIKFRKPQFLINFNTKQKLAEKMIPFIHSINGEKPIKYLEKVYQPNYNFIQSGCQNIVWVLSYLLSYCMEEEWNEFKQTQMCQILQNCILLQFQYDIFLTECLTFYFKNLAKTKNCKLLAHLIVTGFRFIMMTNHHFLLASQRPCDYRQKYFEYQLRNVVNQVVQEIKKKTELSQHYRQKMTALQAFNWPYFKETSFIQTSQQKKKKIKKDIQCILSEIERQFLKSEIDQNQIIFEDVSKQIYSQLIDPNMIDMINFPENSPIFQRPKKQRFKQSLRVYDEIETQIDKQILFSIIASFDEQIDVQQISGFFYMYERYQYCIQKQDIQMIFQILFYIRNNEGCPSLNYKAIVRIFTYNYQLKNIFAKTSKSVEISYQRQMILCYEKIKKVIKVLIERKDSDKQCLEILGILQHQRLNAYVVYEELQTLNKNLSVINLKENNEKYQLKINKQYFNRILVYSENEFHQDSVEYLEQKKLFLKNYLAMIKKNKVHYQQTIRQIVKYYFKKLFFQDGNNLYQILKYWNNIKIKVFLYGYKISTTIQFYVLSKVLLLMKEVKELTQLIGIYCLQNQISEFSSLLVFQTYQGLSYLEIDEELKTVSLQSFYHGFQRLKAKAQNQIKIIPFFFEVLNKQQYMDNTKLWKRTFFQLHQALSKAYSLKYSHKDKLMNYKIQIYLVTLKYLILKNKKKKYITRYIRETLKVMNSKRIFFEFEKDSLQRKADGIINGLYLPIYSRKQRQKNEKITKINKKIKNYKLTLVQDQQQKQQKDKIIDDEDQYQVKKLLKYHMFEIIESFQKLFDVKNISLFQFGDAVFQKYSLWWIQQKYEIQQYNPYTIQQITAKVNQIKIKPQFQISEQAYQIVDQILDFQYQQLTQELKIQKGISPKDVQWIF